MPRVEVPEGYTALVRGPAEVVCVGGCKVFGGVFGRFEVPPYRQYPVEGPAVFEVDGGSVAFVKGSTVPEDWQMELEGIVALVGPVDSGKSALSTFLLNLHVGWGPVCVVDADVGQSDIGPPGFVSFACSTSQTPHISELKPAGGYYVGSVSLQGVEEFLVAGAAYCLKEALASSPRLVLINTPGWTTGRGVQLLMALVDATGARVVNIGERVLKGPVASKPQYVLPRGPQERRALRNLAYRRHISLSAKVDVGLDALSPCGWADGLLCPWGKYVPADVEKPEGRGREFLVPRSYLRHILAGLYRGGRLVGYGVVERISDGGAQLYVSTQDFDEVRIGKIRLDPQGLEELEPLP
ncbi:MAG: Clp1/GlmU family protein [Thermoproteus sp.]